MSDKPMGRTDTKPLPQDPAELERTIEQGRERLAATVDELVRRTRPKALAQQASDDLAGRFRAAIRTEDGQLRVERLAAAGAAVAAIVALLVWRRRSR